MTARHMHREKLRFLLLKVERGLEYRGIDVSP